MKFINRFFSIFAIFAFMHCSSTLLKKGDYVNTRYHLDRSNPERALQVFPNFEKNSFITTMEKTYLNLIQGRSDIKDLIIYSDKIEKRLRYSASREIKTFFYIETPEGYYASEHEVILMHLFLSWGYSLKRNYDKAYVEAKKAANLLNTNWSEEGRFDDPSLRIMLAGMWAMCGHWEEAQVDFKVAYNMDNRLHWALELAELETPPKELYLLLVGNGPEPIWDPKFKLNPIRGMRSLKFVHQQDSKELSLKTESGEPIALHSPGNTESWYQRHFIRDNEIQDIIKDSNYGQIVFAKAIQGTTVSLLGITGGLLIGGLGIGAGAGLIYLAVEAEMAELALLGLAVIAGGVSAGYELAETSVDYSIEETEKAMDNSQEYRYVRFLPDKVFTGYSNEAYSSEPLSLYDNNKRVFIIPNQIFSKPVNVKIVHYTGK
jgi:hypothetical protein